ncbi:PspA/IM30 family protein [Clostridium septicum]|uniref:Phage shock protein A n=1 Tax=Clostridium septicum TaxID=1504 RepID=A0A9N7JMD8_CLOSE|nr:PspA/IM30 family protein [Clostridium septicum]AYE34804.1 phage shock protein A [Clostridium septicum]MDU1313380.1 PspA/IM30 family protein [Clostridium septicum]QAS60199.1 PspA/IM30 family protein [Clostridium septicum]UEC20548.1 PspA/IM30 family protein [Clostridium septicum]USS01398.1 PspA/IM30 family protein [Clostridium septicum]
MGIFNRMSNMFKSKVNSTLDELENPIELLDQKIRDMENQLNKAKLNSAQIIGNAHEIKRKLEATELEVNDLESKVKLALSKGNEDLAKRALAKKIETEKKYKSLKETYEAARNQADSIKKNLSELENEIIKTRSYRDEAAARFSNAEASKKVNEVLANVQTKSNSIKIDDIERKIQKQEALAKGLGELKNTDTFESEFEALDSVDLDLELEKYKNS